MWLMDNVAYETLEIDVYLNYQGRTSVPHTHIFTYDELTQTKDHMLWDNPEERTGL